MPAPDIHAGLARALGGLAIYQDGRLVGFIVDRRHGTDAVLATGAALGRFNDQQAAVRAIFAAAAQ